MSADEVCSGTGMSTTTLTADSLLLKVLLMRMFTCTRTPHCKYAEKYTVNNGYRLITMTLGRGDHHI